MQLSLLVFLLAVSSLLISALPQGNLFDTTNLLGRGLGGWNQVQYPQGSTKSSIPVRGGDFELFALAKDGITKANLKRIVFVLHGKVRRLMSLKGRRLTPFYLAGKRSLELLQSYDDCTP
jgi:hypothetical protein